MKIYKSPKLDGKHYWVPIVCKSKDFLIGHMNGLINCQEAINSLMEENEELEDLNIGMFDVGLDSSRFNDILQNDQRVRDLTKEQLTNHVKELIEEEIDRATDDHPDNQCDVEDDTFLTIDCVCNFGYYEFKTEQDVPAKSFICQNCGRMLIHYTGHYDNEYEYDGE